MTFLVVELCADHPKSLAVVAGAAGCYGIWKYRQQLRGYLSKGPYPSEITNTILRAFQRALIDQTRSNHRINWYPLESSLMEQPRRLTDNGHPRSGAVRDAARCLIVSAVDSIGATKFEISPGGHTMDEERRAHQHYAVADLRASVQESYPQPGDVIVGIDIDYYLRKPEDYFGYPNPVVLHTFQPLTVSGVDADSPFRIIDNKIHYDVSGGTTWQHNVWDWTTFGEHLEFTSRIDTFTAWCLSWLGFRKVMYQKVHYSRPWEDCPHRALVWMVPQYSAWRITWLPTDLRARKLQHIDFKDSTRPGWNSLVRMAGEELRISIGREGEDASVDMRKTDFDILMGLTTAQSVTSRMLGMGYNAASTLALVGQYFRKAEPNGPDPVRLGRPAGVRVHWPAPFEAEEPDSSARAYAAPLVSDENMMPMIKRWECLSMSLERRVKFVRNTSTPPRRYQRYAEEFVRLVVPIPNEGVPMSVEDAARELNKPSQVLAVKGIWNELDMPPRQLIESFVKNEATMKCGRIISSFPDARFLVKFSTFTLEFRDTIFHSEWNKHWFCPGLTPPEIANKVCEYVSTIHTPVEGDFSNLDGTISMWLQRHVMNALYLRWCCPEYKVELQKYCDMMINCPARAKRFGFRYEAGVGVKSGSPTTCDLNTAAGAFIMYCAIRQQFPELTPEEAFQMIGLAFGDDGLFDRTYAKWWQKAAKDCGLTLKVEEYEPEHGVCFLARVFPDPWSTNTSFQDPLRTWRKLHLTTRDKTVPLEDAASDRLEGYLVTDSLTPVTSQYCEMLLRCFRWVSTTTRRLRRKDHDQEKPYWLTIGGAWPQRLEDVPIMEHCIASRTGFDVEKIRELATILPTLNDPWSVPTLNRDEEPSPYRDTLDIDAQPAEGLVDPRNFESDQHVIRSQANRGVPETPANHDQRISQSAAVRAGHGPRRRENRPRHRRLSRVPRSGGLQSGEGDSQLSPEAQGSRSIEQRGSGPPRPRHRRRPGNSNRGRQAEH